jgi:hypothetical protein
VGGVATLAAALGVAACGAPASMAIWGSSSSSATHVRSNVGAESSTRLSLRAVPKSNGPSRAGVNGKSQASAVSNPAWLMSSAEAAQDWIAATNAFAIASLTDYWKSPALAATEVGPELTASQSLLRSHSQTGIVSRGSLRILSVRVTSVSETNAQVVGCVGGDQFDIYLSTGRPVPGNTEENTESRVFSAQVIQTSSGWKLARQSMKEGPCSAG